MDQLISIETVPIKIEYVEKESNRISSSSSASLKIDKHNDRISITSSPVRIRMDSFIPSQNFDTANLSYTATAQYSNDGNLKLNVSMQDIRSTDFRFGQFDRGIDNMIDYFPDSAGFSPSELENIEFNFDFSSLTSGESIDATFTPPDLEFKVVQWPSIIIKYIGDPIYFPKSANPNYKPIEETTNTNGSAYDQKI